MALMMMVVKHEEIMHTAYIKLTCLLVYEMFKRDISPASALSHNFKMPAGKDMKFLKMYFT